MQNLRRTYSAIAISRQFSALGRSASSRSTPAAISAKRLWSSDQIRMQPQRPG